MKILVANLGSTSFKYTLFRLLPGQEEELTRGGYERVSDFGAAIAGCLEGLVAGGWLPSVEALDAVGFKAVLGRGVSGCLRADARVIQALEDFREIAPSHNPVYAEAIRQFARIAPKVERVALFETSFYQWAPEAAQRYAVPASWHEAGVRRYGFHGASHKYIAERSAEWLGREDVAERVRRLYREGPGEFSGRPLRVLSCHLGGSSSVAGIDSGVAIGASMGFSPQGGLPQNNRVGDLDSMAFPFALKTLGLSPAEAERQLCREGGLLGLSGVSNDLRDIKKAAAAGDSRARLAIDVLIDSLRHWMGSFFFRMGGAEAIVFTGGIGENNPDIRAAALSGLEGFGIVVDPEANLSARGECDFAAPHSSSRLLVLPTNEERVVARETYRLLAGT